nr:BBF_HP1_G0028140.mRNA.1.CDS.1 [Saccharomyces cerevisiae]
MLLPLKVPTPALNATTTASTNSSTNATTTASTNSSTNATTTESTNASAKEDANKDGNAEDNRFHPVTDINKESYKRKGVKWFC